MDKVTEKWKIHIEIGAAMAQWIQSQTHHLNFFQFIKLVEIVSRMWKEQNKQKEVKDA